jgi:photosystem II stability/assembly factor-like uncharacterized protein
MKIVSCISAFFYGTLSVVSQSAWYHTNAPVQPRYEDIFFLNKDTGWAASSGGNIFFTSDGFNWKNIYHSDGTYFRSIEFSSPKRGFAGSLSPSVKTLMKTLDGGNTWTDLTAFITGTNKGVCGICCVDTNITYAVGVWSAPGFVLKTTDGGISWTQTNMSGYASRLVDVHFISKNTGFAAGQSNVTAEGALILKTTDGGTSWTKVYTSNHAGEYVWKIQNLDDMNMFGSISTAGTYTAQRILKSMNGGASWTEKIVAPTDPQLHIQGVGFLTQNIGWSGTGPLYETTDGGNNWVNSGHANSGFNRFFRVDSPLAYLAGERISKYSPTPLTDIRDGKAAQKTFMLSLHPNPATMPLRIVISSSHATTFNLRLFDMNGTKEVMSENGVMGPGDKIIVVHKALAKGVYIAYLMVNEGCESRKIVIE